MDRDAYGRDIPISPELWERLRRADPQCVISLIRNHPIRGSDFQHYKRVWIATVKPESEPVFVQAQAVHPIFAEAVRQVVEIAEAKGWLRSEQNLR